MTSESLVLDRIVDDLYAGALEPAAWERGLKSIARLIGGQGPFLLSFNPTTAAVLRDQIYEYDPAVFRDFREQWSAKDIRLPAALSVPVDTAMTERTLLPHGEWERCEAFNEFFKINDAPWLITAWLHKSPEKVALFSVQATLSRGPFGEHDIARVERLVPHVRRALAIKDRLESDVLRNQSLLHAFDRVPFGMMILDANGRVLDASGVAIETLQGTDALQREAGGRFAFTGPIGRNLHRLIASSMRDGHLVDGQIKLPRGHGLSPLSLLLTPLPAQAAAWFTAEPRWLLFIFDPETQVNADVDCVRRDLGISAREAELASLLAAGRTLELAAVQLGISFETVRAHLRSIFGKTGLHTQADLIRRVLTGPAVTRHTTSAGLPRTGDSPPTGKP